jgi:hypothetical protein
MESNVGVTQAINCRQYWQRLLRVVLLTSLPLGSLLTSSCAKLAKVSDSSVPRLQTSYVEADFNQLLAQLKPFTELQSLRTTRVALRFIEPLAEQRWRDAEAIMVLQRPDKIRLVVQIPIAHSRLAEMVSEANHFKVAIYREAPSFLIGTNDADYSRWREKLGKERQSALANARPFHFTQILLMQPLHLGEAGYTYGLEEQLLEETVIAPDGKKTATVLRSYYVISEWQERATGPASVRRRFWFGRYGQVNLARQQLFDEPGNLVTEVYYSSYQKLNAERSELWPSVILVSRPHDGYAARFTFGEESFEVNPELPPTAFTLENKENLPLTDLDKPLK